MDDRFITDLRAQVDEVVNSGRLVQRGRDVLLLLRAGYTNAADFLDKQPLTKKDEAIKE